MARVGKKCIIEFKLIQFFNIIFESEVKKKNQKENENNCDLKRSPSHELEVYFLT
jgi:hypothetical protein